MKKAITTWGVLVLGLGLAIVGACLWAAAGCRSRGGQPGGADTVSVETRVDTIVIREPMPPDTVTIVRYVSARLPVVAPVDTAMQATPDTATHDSADVVVPISQAVYSDSLYTAYISGWQPRLDSLRIYQHTRTVTIEHPAPPPRRWSVGIQAGYGITPAGPQPYVGVGVAFRIY